jgi:hypothetical protein
MLMMSGLIAVQIWISLAIAQARQEIVVLQQEYTFVEQANAEMLWKISQYTSLEHVQREARRAGFVPSLRPSYREAQIEPGLSLSGDPILPLAPDAERVSFLAEPDSAQVGYGEALAQPSTTPPQHWITLAQQRLTQWSEQVSQGAAQFLNR